MSVAPVPVAWNRSKLIYDGVLIAGIAAYVTLFRHFGLAIRDPAEAIEPYSLEIKAWGTCAFLLLTIVLAIGPLARLDPRFLPLLYNRRHFGVITCAVAATHLFAVMGWYFAFSPLDPWVALFASDAQWGDTTTLPFIPFGLLAFLILLVLAATSHDVWLALLTPPVWKAIHMSIYLAYASVVVHVAFGAFQDARGLALPVLLLGSCALLIGLHVAAAVKTQRRDADIGPTLNAGGIPYVDAGPVTAFQEGRAKIVRLAGGEPVAIFRDHGRLSAITNLCAHQNGPLGEGRVMDGCVTCPWHGYQFRLVDGCAPPPFTEKIATYNLALDSGRVLLDPRPNPPGTRVEPLPIPSLITATAGAA